MTTDKTGAPTTVAAESDRFTIAVEGQSVGLAEFADHDGQRVFTHTEVDDAFEGRGLATILVVRGTAGDARCRAADRRHLPLGGQLRREASRVRRRHRPGFHRYQTVVGELLAASPVSSRAMTTGDVPAAFFVADGDTFVPTRIARGPWGPTIGGNLVGGILGHAVERDAGDPALQPARLTVDLLRPVALQPLQVHTSVAREGRRLKLVDAELVQSGTVVARASALFLRRGEQPADEVWTSPVTMPPPPAEPDEPPDGAAMMVWAYGRSPGVPGPSFDLSEWQHDGPKYAWLRDVKLLIDGVPMTPFTRAAMAGDVTSSLTHFGSGGLHFINADYTLTLSRLPDGPYIGLAAVTHYSHAGIATGVASLFDRQGPIGSTVATGLVNPGFAPPSAR